MWNEPITFGHLFIAAGIGLAIVSAVLSVGMLAVHKGWIK